MRCFGVWATVGSTGAWPQVVNLWELDGWKGLAANFEHELVGGGAQDPSLAEWWAAAAELRRGGFDRIVVPEPWSPTIDELTERGREGRGVRARARAAPGRAVRARSSTRSPRPAGPRSRRSGCGASARSASRWSTDTEAIVIWAIPDLATWAAFERAWDGGALAPWRRRLDRARRRRAPHVDGRRAAEPDAHRPPTRGRATGARSPRSARDGASLGSRCSTASPTTSSCTSTASRRRAPSCARAADRPRRRSCATPASNGSAIGVLAPNAPGAIAAWFAVWSVGGAFVPLNPRVPAAERERLIASTGVAAVIEPPAVHVAAGGAARRAIDRRGDHPVHVGHDRPAEGGAAAPRHGARAARRRDRLAARRRPAAGERRARRCPTSCRCRSRCGPASTRCCSRSGSARRSC